jgi:putative ABC transport system substrate-binding protein
MDSTRANKIMMIRAAKFSSSNRHLAKMVKIAAPVVLCRPLQSAGQSTAQRANTARMLTLFFIFMMAGTRVLAQQPNRMFKIGHLSGGTEASRQPLIEAFRQAMQKFGYLEGQTLRIEGRFADGKFERLPTLLQELLKWQPDVLLVSSTPANLAAKAANLNIPIVMVGVADPIGVGLIESLARPGGNITGVTNIVAELAGKRLEILKETVGKLSRVAVIVNPADANAVIQLRNAEAAARALKLQLQPVLNVRRAEDLSAAFETATRARAQAAIRMVDPLGSVLRQETAGLAVKHNLPVIFPFREDVEAGGLISYGTSLPDQYRQCATFVHKILKGTKPADLPVEQPMRFEFAINLKTANQIGLTIPPNVLARADRVIR